MSVINPMRTTSGLPCAWALPMTPASASANVLSCISDFFMVCLRFQFGGCRSAAGLDARVGKSATVLLGGQAWLRSVGPSLLQKLHGKIDAYVLCLYHRLDDPGYVLAFCPRCQRNVAGVQSHMAALYAFGGQGSQRGHVLRQAHGDGHLGQFLRGGYAKNLQG